MKTKKAVTTNKPKAEKRKVPLIAICDDHIQTAISISQILEHEGYKTMQTYSAVDAIALCEREKPDFLILDIRLDGFSGYDVAGKLPEQKLVFITGFDINETRVKEFKNAVGVLQKPLDMEKLINIVKKAVGPAH